MTTSLKTDLYELTMLRAARQAGIADRRCVFEVFVRSLPEGRRYGVLAGTGRILEAIRDFRFDDADLEYLRSLEVLDEDTLAELAAYRFEGTVTGYAEGELFFPGSPVLRVEGSFAQAVLLETVILSIVNHDSSVASVGARMVTAARGRPCIEMGGRRVHEEAAVAAARAASLVGFASTSNLEAGRRYGVPVAGTAAHAFTLLFETEEDAFRAQISAQGAGTSVLVDTYDVETAVATAVEIAGTRLGAVRLDSGDLAEQAIRVREQLDRLGARSTRIIATSDLDEHRLEELAPSPLDAYGVGTRLVTGGGHPAPGFVYKLVEREGSDGSMHPVGKRSESKSTLGGAKRAFRLRAGGTAQAEIVLPSQAEIAAFETELMAELERPGVSPRWRDAEMRELQIPLIESGEILTQLSPAEQLRRGREHHRMALDELGIPSEDGPDGPCAIPTVTDGRSAAAVLG